MGFQFQVHREGKPPSATALGVDGDNITIFDAIDKQLGLKLDTARIPTPVIIVDSANRKPPRQPAGGAGNSAASSAR